ncbi:MAG: ATP-grasp domain-containing protein [Ignavibacteriales bacterium]|nr:ATP-grasp domain-containing protein [Ignavibacteriales bacterium]
MIDRKAKILICYNEPIKLFINYLGKEIHSSEEDVDTSESELANHISEVITSLQVFYDNIEVLTVNQNIESFLAKIKHYQPDVIFNFVESVNGISHYEAYIAGLYDVIGIDYTGNTPICLATCLDKSRTKQILKSFDIKVPNYYVAALGEKLASEKFQLKFPVILKLLKEDASIGISEFSVVNSLDETNNRLKFLFKTYKQDVLIEEYINGRELNVAILGEETLPISEIDFTGLPKDFPKIVTYEGKWSPKSVYFKFTNPICPAIIDDDLKNKIEATAKKVFQVMNCRDYARVDMRISKSGVPYVIEVNPNPDLSSDAGFARAAAATGISYPELLKTVLNFAFERRLIDSKIKV